MTRLPKLVQFTIYLALACLVAGLFGMIHNQVSYTLGPDYFHKLKFIQFRVSPDFPPRLAAAIVGWKASWWMGLVIGLPLFLLALFSRERADYARLCRMGFLTVIVTTIVLGIVAVILGLTLLTADMVPPQFDRYGADDPLGFARAAALHDTSYFGGVIGLVIALVRMSITLVRNRSNPRTEM